MKPKFLIPILLLLFLTSCAPFEKRTDLLRERDKFLIKKKYLLPNRVISHGRRDKPWIALTFDDGPHPTETPRILKILKKYDVPATFFVVGKMVKKYPDLILDEIAAGHEIGSHTYHHIPINHLSSKEITLELEQTASIIKNVTGEKVRLFRPPAGYLNQTAVNLLDRLGYTTVLWTNNAGDYVDAQNGKPKISYIEGKVLSGIRSGGIILMHDGLPKAINLLPTIIERLKGKGFKFVTVSRLANGMKQ
jgi:peptidoglycan/xylan/chitin deacetylase (PgdA/CDA1 family)